MINEPTIDAKFKPPLPPLNKIKTEESAEIARLTQEFEARGGKIKKEPAKKLCKNDTFLVGDAFTVWPQREYVLRLMREKFITRNGLATKTKINYSLICKILVSEQLPDKHERELILNTVESWGQ